MLWRFACLSSLASLVFLVACNDVIDIPVRACVVQGTELTRAPGPAPNAMCVASGCYYTASQDTIDSEVQDLFNQINRSIWAQAKIGFLACCQSIPIILDPDLTVGKIGEIAFALSLRVSSEMDTAFQECKDAWGAKGIQQGTVVLFARNVIGPNGEDVPQFGITTPPPPTLDTCREPRAISPDDVANLYSVVSEPAAFGFTANQKQGSAALTLAHELGHTLLLGHGDGLDNDNNGAQPPNPGSRLFDLNCDFAEYQKYDETYATQSLMDAVQSGATNLTPLQIELAREAAIQVPGHAGP